MRAASAASDSVASTISIAVPAAAAAAHDAPLVGSRSFVGTHDDLLQRPVAQQVLFGAQPREIAHVEDRRVERIRQRSGSESQETKNVVRTAGLGARPDRRMLPSAERLAPHDRAGDMAVHVDVADIDAVGPVRDLVGVE